MKHLLIILLLFTSCRSASDLVRAAQRKDPNIFKSDTVTKLIPVRTTQSQFEFDCVELMKGNAIELYSPVLTIINGDTSKANVKVNLKRSATDSTRIDAKVDCPPAEVRTETITRTILLQPTWKEKTMLIGIGALIVFIILGWRR